jgi:hypothetical protein
VTTSCGVYARDGIDPPLRSFDRNVLATRRLRRLQLGEHIFGEAESPLENIGLDM